MSAASTFNAASAQAAAIPDTLRVALSSGGQAEVCRLSWLQFEALWSELAALLSSVAGAEDQPLRHRDTEKQERKEEAGHPVSSSVSQCLSGEDSALVAALSSAPQLILRLAALSLRLPEETLAGWPPCDVLAVAGVALELNFIKPAGVRDFFASVARLGG